MTTYETEYTVAYKVTIHDPNVIARVLENHDDEGNPVPRSKGSGGWQDTYYDLTNEDEVIEMLVWNIGVNERRLSQLDGWADMADDAVEVEEIRYSSYFSTQKMADA